MMMMMMMNAMLLLPLLHFLSFLPFLSAFTPNPVIVTKPSHHPFYKCLTNHSTIDSNLIFISDTIPYNFTLKATIKNTRVIAQKRTNFTTPLFIVIPSSESDVQASVLCARRHDLHLRILSGGHDYEGLSYISHSNHPFIIVDIHKLSSINIDAHDGTAWVQAGASLGELYYSVAAFSNSSAFPAGVCPTVGVGGHLSGGGFGTMVRKYGLAADNIIDARVVNSDGRVLDREAMGEDLFWAIRGGGGASFGVILAYKIKLVQVPPKVTVFTVSKSLSQNATRLVNKWEHIAYKLDERLFIRAILQVDGENQFENKTIKAIFNSLFLGSKEELVSIMKEKFPELGLEAKECAEMTWIQSVLYFAGYPNGTPLTALLDRSHEFNSSFKAKSDFVEKPIPEQALERLWRLMMETEERTIIIVDPYGGRMDEISESETPFPHRKGNLFNIQYLVKWSEVGAEDDEKHLEWLRRLYEFMSPYASKDPRGAYLNYRDLDLGRYEDGDMSYSKGLLWGKKYFKGNFERLVSVKSLVDPHNFFRDEQSIPPGFTH